MTSSVNIQYGETVLYPEIPDTATVSQLKESIDETWGYAIQKQELHFLGLPIEVEDTSISEFLQLGFGSSFSLVLREDEKLFGNKKPARDFSTDKALHLICGGRTSFEAIPLEPGKTESKKLKAKMFGNMERFAISDHCEGEPGKRIFTTRIYEIKETGKIRIEAAGVDFKVLIPNGNKEIEIKPINTKTYDESQIKNKREIILDVFKALIQGGMAGVVQAAGDGLFAGAAEAPN